MHGNGADDTARAAANSPTNENPAVGTSRNLKRPRATAVLEEDVIEGGGKDERSLLNEEGGSEHVTAFNLEEAREVGDILKGEDGVIPRVLADLAVDESPSVSSSSEDEREGGGSSNPTREEVRQKAKERKAVADDGEWSDGEEEEEADVGDSANGKQDGNGLSLNQHKRARVSGLSDLLIELVTLLNKEETCSELIRRYGGSGNAGGLENATELCQRVMEGGLTDVYELRREVMVAKCGRWKLKWERKGGDEEFGPFDVAQMREWAEGGYFSQAGNKAMVRCCDGGQTWWDAELVFCGAVASGAVGAE